MIRRWLLIFLGGAVCACGHVKPPPPSDCLTACAHTAKMKCATSEDLCQRLCAGEAPNQPNVPGCINAATTCEEADACR